MTAAVARVFTRRKAAELRALVMTLLLVTLGGGPRAAAQPRAANVTGAQVRAALGRGVLAIKSQQGVGGAWNGRYANNYPGGETCLATLALLRAGESVNSPSIVRALGEIAALPNQRTYVVGLKLMVLAQADPTRFADEIQRAADWLIAGQGRHGLWWYDQNARSYDNSNTQFALLGLHAAAHAGARIPHKVWQRARQRLLNDQNGDGGWSYRRDNDQSYGSMTAAGLSGLMILGAPIIAPLESGYQNGVAPRCGRYRSSRAVTSALAWIGGNFTTDQNPEYGRWKHYWLYAVERAGMLTGQRMFGRHDWYRAGAAELVRTQGRTGLWNGDLVDTCLAVLFLAKGHKPLLVQKLKWSDDNAWNPDRHDVENLIAFIGDKLGEPVSWQTIEFDAPLEEWLAAPLLYMQGHEFPDWSPAQCEKVRQFIEQGGTLFAEACCSRESFRVGFERFAAEMFPELPLRELEAAHPIYSSFYDLKPAGLFGIDYGCRTSIIFAPRDVSCLWEQGDVPKLSEEAFKLGVNLAAFATGRSALRDRLDTVTIVDPTTTPITAPTRDALRLAQVRYAGDWRPDPHALVHFAEFLRDQANLDVVSEYAAVALDDDQLATSPFLFLTGHFRFELSESERAALREHLSRGGFLFAEACCGRAAFDAAFRTEIAQVLPDAKLERLPSDHPIFHGSPGFDVRRIGYKPAVLAEDPDRTTPELWGIALDGRLVVVYSPFSIGCGLDGHVCFQCRGVVDEDARRLAANVVLYALTH